MRRLLTSRNVRLFIVATALIDMGVYGLMDVFLNFFYRSLGFDVETISVINGSQRLGALLFSLPAGLIVTRLGARRTFMIAALMITAGMVGMTLGEGFAWQYAMRVLMGAGYTTVFIAGIPMVGALVRSEEYTAVFSLQFIIVASGITISNTVGGSLPGVLSSLLPALGGPESQGAYAASLRVAAALVAISVMPLVMLPQAKRSDSSVQAHPRTPTPWVPILLMSLPMLIFGVGAGLTIPYYNLFFRDTFGLPDDVIGQIFSLGSLAMLVLSLGIPYTAHRLGQTNALVAAMIATTVAFFLLSLPFGIAFSVVAYALALGLRNTMSPLYNPLLLDYVRQEHVGMVSSISTAAWSLGFFTITLFAGGWVEQFGYSFLFQVTAATTLITGIAALLIFGALRGMKHEVTEAAASAGD
jgi:MFS family permease